MIEHRIGRIRNSFLFIRNCRKLSILYADKNAWSFASATPTCLYGVMQRNFTLFTIILNSNSWNADEPCPIYLLCLTVKC